MSVLTKSAPGSAPLFRFPFLLIWPPGSPRRMYSSVPRPKRRIGYVESDLELATPLNIAPADEDNRENRPKAKRPSVQIIPFLGPETATQTLTVTCEEYKGNTKAIAAQMCQWAAGGALSELREATPFMYFRKPMKIESESCLRPKVALNHDLNRSTSSRKGCMS